MSLLGDQISLLALPLVAVLALDASAAQMGYSRLRAAEPSSRFARSVCRPPQRRRTMIAADVVRAGLIATVPVAYVFDELRLEQLYVVAFLVGAMTVLFGVANASLFQTIVPREQFVEASSLLNGSRAFSFVAGPTVAGFLVQALTAGPLLVDAFSFLGSGALRIDSGGWRPRTTRPGSWSGCWIRRGSSGHARRDGDDQLLQLRVLRVVRPLRDADARGVAGHARPRTRRRRRGRLVGSVVAGPVSRRIGVGPMLVLGCVVFPLAPPRSARPRLGHRDPRVSFSPSSARGSA